MSSHECQSAEKEQWLSNPLIATQDGAYLLGQWYKATSGGQAAREKGGWRLGYVYARQRGSSLLDRMVSPAMTLRFQSRLHLDLPYPATGASSSLYFRFLSNTCLVRGPAPLLEACLIDHC